MFCKHTTSKRTSTSDVPCLSLMVKDKIKSKQYMNVLLEGDKVSFWFLCAFGMLVSDKRADFGPLINPAQLNKYEYWLNSLRVDTEK